MQALQANFQTFEQVVVSTIETAKRLRNHGDILQKICQVAFPAIQLLMLYNPGLAPLSRFAFVLAKTASMHDFYRLFVRPRSSFLPLTADTLDATAIYKALTDDCRNRYGEIDQDKLGHVEVVHKKVDAFFQEMRKLDDAYHNMQEVAIAFLSYVDRNGGGLEHGVRQSIIDILTDNPKQFEVQPTLIASIANKNWMVVDMGCVALCFQEWNLLDTAKWAARVGQYSAFRWVSHLHLEKCVVALVATGFAWSALEAFRRQRDDSLTHEQFVVERWNVIANGLETVAWGTTFAALCGVVAIAPAYLYGMALFVKSVGLMSLLAKPAVPVIPGTDAVVGYDEDGEPDHYNLDLNKPRQL